MRDKAWRERPLFSKGRQGGDTSVGLIFYVEDVANLGWSVKVEFVLSEVELRAVALSFALELATKVVLAIAGLQLPPYCVPPEFSGEPV